MKMPAMHSRVYKPAPYLKRAQRPQAALEEATAAEALVQRDEL